MGSSVSIGLPDVSEAIEQTSELLEDKEKLRELWLRVDENKNGFITLSEFSKMIAEADGDDSPVFSDFDNPKAIERCVRLIIAYVSKSCNVLYMCAARTFQHAVVEKLTSGLSEENFQLWYVGWVGEGRTMQTNKSQMTINEPASQPASY